MEDRTRDLRGSQPRIDHGPRELVPGERVGDWMIGGILGGGGFGTVYEVRHARTNQPAALKLLHAHFVTSVEMLARFEREIDVLRRMRHPNVVHLLEAGFSQDQRPYLCTELLVGEELNKLIARTGRIAPLQALEVFEPLCEALAAAHELGIVHRDIKASNVIVCRGEGASMGRVVLLDFGIAKLSDALAPELTASRQSLGTPSCMAPEQIHGLRVDGRTDVYALGGLLFHMLTGHLPFQDSSATMTQYLHLHARRPSVSSVVAVSRRLDDVIACAMAIEPSDRFDHPRSLLAAARAALRETSIVQIPSADVPCFAVMVSASDRRPGASLDGSMLDDLESVLPIAERILVGHGFQMAVDLGSSALFVARAETVPDPVGVANAMFDQLARRPRPHPRVKVGIAVHAGEARYVGMEIQPCALLRPATWNLPEEIEGLWVTGKLDATSPAGRCVRS